METLKRYAAENRLQLTDEMLGQFQLYRDFLLDWNTRMNLTAITEPAEIEMKHFLDSLLLCAVVSIPTGAKLIDVGTGAGFPSVPLKIYRSDLHITLLDSLQKRLRFLEELSKALHQENTLVHGRAEQLSHNPGFREQYDVATARAVANLSALCEYCLPYVKPGGLFLAMKGPKGGEELEASREAIRRLGGKPVEIIPYALPDGDSRRVIVIKKISQTPSKYPRQSVKITKTPL